MPAYNEEGHPIASSRRNKKTLRNKEMAEGQESAGNQASGSENSDEKDQADERAYPAKRKRPAGSVRPAKRKEATPSKKTSHSYDQMPLDELTQSYESFQSDATASPDESPEVYETAQLYDSSQPYDASLHESDPSYESFQPYDPIHPDEPFQPDATAGANATGHPDEIEEMNPVQYLKGRGAQFNPKNRFLKNEIVKEHIEGIDDWIEANPETQFLEENAKGLVNKVDSPDVGMAYSMNPYQGCEHGCTYCYARNVHEYWGYSAGLDFEQKIIVKKNAPELLRKFLMNPKWECVPLSLSGNTDCYQPAEKKFGITRQLLEVCLEFNQPVGIITKNAGILRDKDLLAKMAKKKLVSVLISITSFDEELRRTMEPRTTTAKQRIRTIKELSDAGVRMGVMLGPMIPGLNEHELQRIMKAAAENGATFSAYTFIRLNGAVKLIFHDWLYKNFPDRADKVWHFIESGHGGKVNDSRFGVRMRGEGNIAQLVAQQYARYTEKYGLNAERWELDTTQFMRPGGQMKLF